MARIKRIVLGSIPIVASVVVVVVNMVVGLGEGVVMMGESLAVSVEGGLVVPVEGGAIVEVLLVLEWGGGGLEQPVGGVEGFMVVVRDCCHGRDGKELLCGSAVV